MRRLIAAACSAGVAVVAASPAIAAAPPPTVPSDSAIAQYIEAVPSATGPVPIGGAASPASSAALPTAVRAKVERTAGADAPALLQIAQDPKFGARPVRRVNPTRAIPRRPPVLESTGTPTPSPFAAATSTAGSGELLVVALMLVAITAAGIAARVRQR
jgi:hypothetical protein